MIETRYVQSNTIRGKAQIAIDPTGVGNIEVHKDGMKYSVLRSDAPAYLKQPGNYYVAMNREGSRIYSAAPPQKEILPTRYARMYTLHDGEIPMPRLQPSRTEVKPDGERIEYKEKLQFTVVLRVPDAAPQYPGFEFLYYLPYSVFHSSPDGGVIIIDSSHPKAKKLQEILPVLGMDFATDELKWSDNLLPDLDIILKSKAALVRTVVKENGTVESISEYEIGLKPEL